MYSAPTAIMAGEQTLSGTGSQGRCSHEEGGLYSRLTFAVGPQGIGNRCIQFPLANHICGHRHGCQGVDGPCSSPSVRISAPSSNVAFMTSSTRAAQGLRRAGAIVMDGVRVALDVREELANAIRRAGVTPGLATIIVGRDAPSLRYVRNKATAAIAIGCDSFTRMLPESTTERQLLDVIAEFNADPQVHGIIVQLPLPDHIDPGAVLQSIDIGKDVDGFHPLNMGRLAQLKTWTWDSRSALQIVEDEYPAHAPLNAPCAPQACLTLLDKYDVPIEGRIACVVGRSNIVGLPTTLMLMKRGATVVNVSKMTGRAAAADLCRSADIVVAAVGVPEMVDASWVKPGAAVLDVGMNYVGAGRRCVGDVAFDDVSRVAGYLSPVPGGIGPVCVAELLRNTLRNALATKSREGDRRPRLRPAAG